MGTHFHRFSSMTLLLLTLTLATAGEIAAAAPDAATHGDEASAWTQMAIRYEHAEGVARDLHQAANLYCRAARSGRAEAQYRLGWMYANGRGVARDDGIAAALFTMAAAQGHAQSKRILLYVRPNSATKLPACMLVTVWVPSLKLSRDLATADHVDPASAAYMEPQAALGSRPAMQAAR